MKQEEIDALMLKIDKKCKFPKYWDKFIKENSKMHHLIIKDKEKKNYIALTVIDISLIKQ